MSDAEQKSEASEGDEEQMETPCEDDQSNTRFGPVLGVESKDDGGSRPLNVWMRLLESEWSRREVAMEQASWRHFYDPVSAGE